MAPVPVTSYTVNLKGIAGTSLWPYLSNSPLHTFVRTGPIEIFGTQAVRALIIWKWEVYGMRAFVQEMFCYLVFMLLFTLTVLSLEPGDEANPVPEFTSATGLLGAGHIILEVTVLFLNLLYLIGELTQIRRDGLKQYFSSAWNFLGISSESLIMILVPLRLIGSDTQWPVASLATQLLWFRSLYFARGFRKTGPLLRMVFRIVDDIIFFMILLFIVLTGYAISMRLLFRTQTDPEEGYETFWMSLLSSYRMFLSNFDIEVLWGASSQGLALFLFVCFSLLQVIFVNLLIAIMWDSYKRVQKRAETEFRYEQARIIVGVERTLTAQEMSDPMKFPDYLHLLIPSRKAQPLQPQKTGIVTESEDSNRSLYQIFRLIQRVDERQQAATADLTKTIQALEERQNRLIHELRNQHNSVQEVLARVEELDEGAESDLQDGSAVSQ
eukprot:GILK01012079.1.p1 GENE.GILK01012079.1~~GILK01012079.1.p1  ORF type:complete len:488 (+),score=86.91 GILK01012079.1:145-1464(+)